MTALVLASTSPFRKEILKKLGVPFAAADPKVDEQATPDESATALVERLAIAKASAVAPRHPDSLIVGSDQLAVLDDQVLGKPHTHENAVRQLTDCSGRAITFYTGICLYNSTTNRYQSSVELFRVHFRKLSKRQIESYLQAEQPYNCAGSFKSEGLGISLFERLEGDDPNTLIGLPLIRLISMLDREGIQVP